MSNVRRVIGFCCVVVLSVVLPMVLVVCSGYRFFFSTTEPFEIASLKNGEMWFTEYHSTGLFDSPSFAYVAEFKSRNLATGTEQIWNFDPAIQNDNCTPLWIGDECYFVSTKGIYQRVDSKYQPVALPLKQIALLPNHGTIDVSARPVFVYNGELTTVVEDQQTNCRLMHLREGHWVDGRQIRLPSLNCHWFKDPVDGQHKFQPAIQPAGGVSFRSGINFGSMALPPFQGSFVTTTVVGTGSTVLPLSAIPTPTIPGPQSPPGNSDSSDPQIDDTEGLDETNPAVTTGMFMPLMSTSWSLKVQQLGENVHVLYATDGGFTAYRNGFDFVDDTEEGISALAAENVMRDPNGWEPVIPGGEYIQHMVCDHEGAVFSSMNGQLFRRTVSGVWSTINGFDDADSDRHAVLEMSTSLPRLIADSSEGIVYVASETGEVFRIVGETAQPTSFKVDDYLGQYLARWKWLLLGLTGAWLLHYLIVVTGTSFLVRKGSSSTYEFGNQNVTLASIWRRGLAYLIDVAILVAVLSVSLWLHSRVLGITFASSSPKSQVNSLMMLESTLMYDGWQTLPMLLDSLIEVIAQFFFDLHDGALVVVATVFATVLVDTGFALWSLKIFDEGRYGSTPGKWLLGIRTLRSTLRKSGFARALVRDVLSCVDLLGFLTPLPAAASMVFSSHRQRLGDRVADTIVIDANSKRESSTSSPSNNVTGT